MPNKTFEQIVKEAVGKNVQLHIVIANNPPYTLSGKLLEVNENWLAIENVEWKTKIYVNMRFSSIASIEIINGES